MIASSFFKETIIVSASVNQRIKYSLSQTFEQFWKKKCSFISVQLFATFHVHQISAQVLQLTEADPGFSAGGGGQPQEGINILFGKCFHTNANEKNIWPRAEGNIPHTPHICHWLIFLYLVTFLLLKFFVLEPDLNLISTSRNHYLVKTMNQPCVVIANKKIN